MKYKIDVSGENSTQLVLHCYSQGLHGRGTKSGVISVSCAPSTTIAELGLWGSGILSRFQAGRCLIWSQKYM